LQSSITLLESEVLPQFLIKELIDWGIAIDTSTGIAVPIPDSSAGGAFLIYLYL